MKSKQELTKKDLNALALFFDEYLQDGDINLDNELTRAVNKIFKITNWWTE